MQTLGPFKGVLAGWCYRNLRTSFFAYQVVLEVPLRTTTVTMRMAHRLRRRQEAVANLVRVRALLCVAAVYDVREACVGTVCDVLHVMCIAAVCCCDVSFNVRRDF